MLQQRYLSVSFCKSSEMQRAFGAGEKLRGEIQGIGLVCWLAGAAAVLYFGKYKREDYIKIINTHIKVMFKTGTIKKISRNMCQR